MKTPLSFEQFARIAPIMEGTVNRHMEHVDELMYHGGVEGLRASILYLKNVTDYLSGHAAAPVNVTTKFDGSPAIITGINPENGKFFVATKGVFAKTPKVNYTNADIDRNHSGELAAILKVALKHLSTIGITGILQGDLMFIKGQTEVNTIEGVKYLTFKRNTITYAVPLDSDLARSMQAAEIGIVFHTTYTGPSLSDLNASFKIDLGALRKTPKVWFSDATYRDVSGTATMTAKETSRVRGHLTEIGKLFQKLDSKFLKDLSQNELVRILVMTHNNSVIRSGGDLARIGPAAMTKSLRSFVQAKYQKELADAKAKKSLRLNAELESMNAFMAKFEDQFLTMFKIQALMNEAKGIVVGVLERAKTVVSKFVLTDKGYVATGDEGFVAVDHLGGAVKLVNRAVFSNLNFNLAKSWTK